jgi:DNA-binding MarR family transcriptional regulator
MTAQDPALVAADLRLAIGRLVRRVRREDRIPAPHAAALGYLERDGSMTTSDLARAAGVRPQSMGRTVAQLTEHAWVTTHPHPTDGRKALLDLTDAGRAVLHAERERRVDWLANAFAADLSTDEQDLLARSVALLHRLADR